MPKKPHLQNGTKICAAVAQKSKLTVGGKKIAARRDLQGINSEQQLMHHIRRIHVAETNEACVRKNTFTGKSTATCSEKKCLEKYKHISKIKITEK